MTDDEYRRELKNLVHEGVRSAVGEASRCALLMYRDAPNVGDAAIWLAQRSVLRSLGVDVAYAEAGRFFRHSTFSRSVPEGPILISGGGSLGTTWVKSHEFKERIIREYPDRRVVILPQSANFSTPESLERFLEIASAHPDLKILVRDAWTHEALQALGSRVMLVPDMVFALEHPRLTPGRGAAAGPGGVLWLLREDAEATGRSPAATPGRRADWSDAAMVRWSLEFDKLVARTRFSPVRRTRLGEWKAEKRVDDGLALLSGFDLVVTDRLHGAVLAFLLGKPCVVLDNSWGKVHRFCKTWFAGSDSVRLVSDVSEAYDVVEQLKLV